MLDHTRIHYELVETVYHKMKLGIINMNQPAKLCVDVDKDNILGILV